VRNWEEQRRRKKHCRKEKRLTRQYDDNEFAGR
jgi:hypothetical protein